MRALLHLVICLLPLAAAAKPPNIIYILLDDAGYGDLSCYGQEKFTTPNVDRLAREGMRFTQHYSGSTVCAPTRSTLMTGLHTGHTPIRGNREHKPVGQVPLPAEAVTVAEALKGRGYATAAFGKWGLGFPGSEGDPLNQGFDRFYGWNCQRNAHTYYPTWLYDDREKTGLDGKTYAHTLVMDKSLEWVRGNKDGPFFLYLAVTIPHAAMHVPEKYAAPFRKKFPQFEHKVARYGNNRPFHTNPAAQFAGMMTVMDEGVGKLLRLLRELGIDANTVVMLSSDNGPHLEGGHMPDFFNSSGGLRGHKRDLTEGGIRAPLLVRWPGKVKPGTTSDHISAHWDLFPTLCEIAGADVPDGLDGISYLPELLGNKQEKHAYLYWEFHGLGGRRALRFGKNGAWKAVQNNMSANRHAPVALYHLPDDPREKTDVSAAHPALVRQATDILAKARTRNPRFQFQWERQAERP